VAWQFLETMISSWSWIKRAYGSDRECRAAIMAYYQMLSFMNFIKLFKENQLGSAQIDRFGSFPVSSPLCFCVGPHDQVMSGYKLFLKQNRVVQAALDANGVSQTDFEAEWPKWMNVVGNWLGQVYVGRWPEMHTPQNSLPKDLKASPYVL
jgi:hypothetical protein